MSEGPPSWNIAPPLNPTSPAYHVWRESDSTSDLAHGWDWATTEDQPGAVSLPAPYPHEAWLAMVADAAIAASPALAEMIRLWPYPGIDTSAVRELVRILQAQEK